MWPQTNFEKKVFVKMILKLRRSKSQSDLRKVKSPLTLCRILTCPAPGGPSLRRQEVAPRR